MSDDLISKQEVLNKFNELDQQELYLPCHFKEFVIDEVSNIPQKMGRWINIKPLLTAAKCSECKSAFADRTNYCPYCGAKMKEIDSNEQLLSQHALCRLR